MQLDRKALEAACEAYDAVASSNPRVAYAVSVGMKRAIRAYLQAVQPVMPLPFQEPTMPSDVEIDALIERLTEAANLRPPLLASPMLEKAAHFLAALRDERNARKREAGAMRDKAISNAQERNAAEASVRELEQKLERARVALEPFSQFAKGLTSVEHDTHYIGLQTNGQPDLLGIELRHFRRARAALAEIGQRG